ncbi:MAG: hypothetical protein FJ042_04985 [Candidatus Cloacimonetes bacterium]|nr:hypothetical protein [Candidatus Cloacimonadota bacterium]
MQKRQDVDHLIAFGGGLTALCTIIVPALSMVLAAVGIVFGIVAYNATQKWMARSGLAMAILALILDLIYWYVVMVKG